MLEHLRGKLTTGGIEVLAPVPGQKIAADIQDDVRVTPRGPECLTRIPRRIEDVILN